MRKLILFGLIAMVGIMFLIFYLPCIIPGIVIITLTMVIAFLIPLEGSIGG